MSGGAPPSDPDVLVVGAGLFGLTAAVELVRRGRSVVVLDPGPVPHPQAASTDRSKIVRLDYGPDALYTAAMEDALEGWRRWQHGFPTPLFHETGVLFLARSPLAPGGFEHESLRVLESRGHRPERLSPAALRERFPAWNAAALVDGYLNPEGGWVESGRVLTWLAAEATRAGARLREGARVTRLVERSGRVAGVALDDGTELHAREAVVVATGSWTPHLLPETAPFLRSPGQPVFLLRPDDPAPFAAARFPVWAADIARTGWYGFPAGHDGIVKIARHGAGRPLHPESPERAVNAEETAALRAFLAESLPVLASAPLAATRVCLYADSPDGHLWIAADPARPGLVLATGGSGHAFKLAPLLGAWVAAAVEGDSDGVPARFRWRPEVAWRNEEAARFAGEPA